MLFLLVVSGVTIATCSPRAEPSGSANARTATAAARTSRSTPPTVAVAGPAGSVAAPRSAGEQAELDTAIARWTASAPPSYAYTVGTVVDGFGATTDRIIAIEGRSHRASILASSFVGWDDDAIAVDGLFRLIRARLEGPGTVEASYDPEFGIPLTIASDDPSVSEGSTTVRVHDVRSSADGQSAAERGQLLTQLRDARTAWKRWAPSDYAYDWQRIPSIGGGSAASGPTAGGPAVGGSATAVGWTVRHVDGVTTVAPASTASEAAASAGASVAATFDVIESALAAGAWVDVVFDPILGLPLLVGIDPTPAVGDGFIIRISFHDIVADRGRADLLAARERWAANRPVRYSYVWREIGHGRRWMYRVSMAGEVATIRRSGDAPIGEAAALAPRIDDLFLLLDEVLADGGRVDAQYDRDLGFPTRVTIETPGSVIVGTITIRSMAVDATP